MLEVLIARNENNGKEYCSNAAEIVAEAKDRWDLTPKQIAKICGCDPSTVSGWVSKKSGAPKLLQRLADYLNAKELEDFDDMTYFRESDHPELVQIEKDDIIRESFDLFKQGKTLEEAQALLREPR